MISLEKYCQDIAWKIAMPPIGRARLSTGFNKLDSALSRHGSIADGLITIAAKAGTGVFTFCLDIALNAAISSGREVLIFSPVKSGGQIVEQLIQKVSGVDIREKRDFRNMDENAQSKLYSSLVLLRDFKIIIDDSKPEIDNIKRALEYVNPSLIIIDNPSELAGKIDDNLSKLFMLSRAHALPIIITAPVTGNKHKDKTLMLKHIDSVYTEKSDVVMALYKEPYILSDNENPYDLWGAKVFVLKNIHGTCDTIPLRYDGIHGSFVE